MTIHRENRAGALVEKIQCKKCGFVGYSASPESVRCSECGGTSMVISLDKMENKSCPAILTDYLRRILSNNKAKNAYIKDKRGGINENNNTNP